MDDKFFIPERPTAYEQRTIEAQSVPKFVDTHPPGHQPERRTLSGGRMTVLAIITALILGSIFGGITWLASAREAARGQASNAACRSATIELEIAQSAGPLVSLARQGADVVAKVSWRSWTRINRQAQISVAMAVYCLASGERNGGIALIVDQNDTELGRVVDGKWVSKLFAE
ncbi:hypothetical protein JJB09_02820 [Rhizobium sp. KVB221]|uniref:Uncharacterized protein n=1 Tax=Rhizobium setariae TaxID=2801340 RepID=A0A936YQH5_9HYPH|nr:hypothetical protein [Rhizobium setariae]MBL0370951.1 hypothetical protein [Rhizobium setariae]